MEMSGRYSGIAGLVPVTLEKDAEIFLPLFRQVHEDLDERILIFRICIRDRAAEIGAAFPHHLVDGEGDEKAAHVLHVGGAALALHLLVERPRDVEGDFF